MEIVVNKLISADKYELAKFAWAVNQRAVQEAFARYGILIEDENDLKVLARLHDEKGDVAGIFKNKNGDSIPFNFEEILADVQMNDDDEDKVKHLNLNWA